MIIEDYFTVGDVVNFTTYATAILGSDFQRAKVLAVLDAETAKMFGIDPLTLHIAIKPSLPPGSPDKYTDYMYVKLQMPNGDVRILGLPWIDKGTIEVLSNATGYVKVELTNPQQLDKLIKVIRANGFTNIVESGLV